MEFTVLKTKICLSPLFFSVLTLFLLFDKSGIALSVLGFSFLHECAHFVLLLIFRTFPQKISLNLFGIEMSLKSNLSELRKMSVFSAGFVLNFILAAFFFFSGEKVSAIINLYIGIFSFIPLPSTDGGEIIEIITDDFFSEKKTKICRFISFFSVLITMPFLIFMSFCKGNYIAFAAMVYMIICKKKKAR